MEDMLLSAGALTVMMSGEAVDEAVVVQVLGSVKLDGIVEEHERYRLLISDGRHVISHVMIALKMNDMGTTTPPERFSVIHVKEYFTILIPRPGVIRVMLALTDIQVLFPADEIQWPIGNPSALFDEDVVIVPGDTSLLSLPEPVFESANTVHMGVAGLSGTLSPVPVRLSTVVVQTPPEAKPEATRALSPANLASTSTSSALSELIVPTASTVRTTSSSGPLSPVPVHVQLPIAAVKSPSTQVTTPAVQLTHPAASTPVARPSSVQTPTPVVKPAPPRIPAPDTSRTGAFSTSVPLVTPIANLRPTARKWIIKARVTAKSPVKSWTRGSGCSFTIDLADESGEIKATVFTEWVDKYYGVLQKDHVYYISRGNLKTSNKRYNHLKHDYEMILNGASSVVPCDEDVAIVEAKCKFVPLGEVRGRAHGSVIDVIGVCISAAEVEPVMTRSGVMPKREVTLVDQSATSVILKLWGEHAGTVEPTHCPIIAVRGAMVNEYWGGMNLTTLVSSVVKINPDISEAQQLRAWWYASTGKQ